MSAIDSLVTDLMFLRGDSLDPEALIALLGGQEVLAQKELIDPDMQGPQFENQISPSMPFRRRDERRLMVLDTSVAPMRAAPREETLVPLDLRPAKAELIKVCSNTPVRMGRLFALGSWGDAVLVARNYVDLRGICLLGWVLDPTMDLEGRRRAGQLSQREFEEKFLAYDKRLEELDDTQIQTILENLPGVNVEVLSLNPPPDTELPKELIVVDVLAEDGTWDTTQSLLLEQALAAIDRFSTIIGAKSVHPSDKKPPPAPEPEPEEIAEVAPQTPVPPLQIHKLGSTIVFAFPSERFDLEVAAALGKQSWDSILVSGDCVSGPDRDSIIAEGAHFLAQVEFYSEVFVDGKPLNKSQFERDATVTPKGTKTLHAHFPRFGPVEFMVRADGVRYVSSMFDKSDELLQFVA